MNEITYNRACFPWTGKNSLRAAAAVLALLAGAGYAPTNASAQQVDQAPAAGSGAPAGGLEEVVVTARRVEEKAANVPVSLEAFGAKALEERRIETEADLQIATPGLTVRETSSSNQLNFSLRGQSIDAFSFAAPAVLSYVNEFSVQGAAASDFFDLQSIQVLKGPQGTLFGRNATGGAVLYETHKPEPEFGGYVRVGAGNYADRVFEGAVNIPISAKTAFRLAGQYEARDGYQTNVLLDTKMASIENIAVRASLLLSPTDSLESQTVAGFTYTGGVSAGLKASNAYAPGQVNNGFVLTSGVPSGAIYVPGVKVLNPRVAGLGFNGIFDFLAKQQNYGFYDVFDNQTGAHRAREYLLTNTTTYDATDSITIKNVVGFHRTRSRDNTDVDGSPYEPLLIGAVSGTAAEGYTYVDEQISEELQVSGQALDDRLKYLAGFYYYYGLDRQRIPLTVASDLVTGPLAGPFLREYQTESDSKAVYAQATYRLTDQVNVTGGIRWTSETSSYAPLDLDVNGLEGVKPTSSTAAKPSWTVSLDYKPTDDLLLYVAQRGSWRTGGYNGTATDTLPDGKLVVNSFKPETTWDVEIGAKYHGTVADIPVTANIALYNQEISDVIRAIYLGVSAVSGNVKEAVVRGVETDFTARPTDWLQVGGNIAYTDAEYTQNTATVAGRTVLFGPYGDVPRVSGSFYARASRQLADGSELALRGEVYWQDHYYYSNANDTILPGTVIPAYHLFNARAEWNDISGTDLSADFWVKNLTDEKYLTGGFALGAVVGINAVLPGTPRMFGFDVKYKF